MPYLSKSPSYQFVSCGGESKVKEDGELYSKKKKGLIYKFRSRKGTQGKVHEEEHIIWKIIDFYGR